MVLLNKINKKGFTLVEMVMSIGLVGVLIVMMSPVIINSVNAWLVGKEGTDSISQARYMFNNLNFDLKNVVEVTLAGDFEIEYMIGSDKFRIYAYNYNNGGSPPGNPPYQIRKATSTLSFNYGDGEPLIGNIGLLSGPARPGLEFTYYDDNNQATAVLSDITLINIKLTFKEEVKQGTFETKIQLSKASKSIKRS